MTSFAGSHAPRRDPLQRTPAANVAHTYVGGRPRERAAARTPTRRAAVHPLAAAIVLTLGGMFALGLAVVIALALSGFTVSLPASAVVGCVVAVLALGACLA